MRAFLSRLGLARSPSWVMRATRVVDLPAGRPVVDVEAVGLAREMMVQRDAVEKLITDLRAEVQQLREQLRLKDSVLASTDLAEDLERERRWAQGMQVELAKVSAELNELRLSAARPPASEQDRRNALTMADTLAVAEDRNGGNLIRVDDPRAERIRARVRAVVSEELGIDLMGVTP